MKNLCGSQTFKGTTEVLDLYLHHPPNARNSKRVARGLKYLKIIAYIRGLFEVLKIIFN